MTAKRFTMIYFETDGNLIFDENKHDGEWYDSTECLQDNEIVELLNELHEENIQLKKSYDITEQVNDALSKENEELHQIQQELADENRLLRKEYNTMLDLVLDSGIDYSVSDELEDLE